MRLISLLLFAFSLFFFGCSEEEPQVPIVQTLEVTNSTSSARMFQGLLEQVGDSDTIIAYGFEWENRYGSWKTKKAGRIKKGNFFIRDLTPLSKWSTFTVRAFIETNQGIVYGDPEKFATADK